MRQPMMVMTWLWVLFNISLRLEGDSFLSFAGAQHQVSVEPKASGQGQLTVQSALMSSN